MNDLQKQEAIARRDAVMLVLVLKPKLPLTWEEVENLPADKFVWQEYRTDPEFWERDGLPGWEAHATVEDERGVFNIGVSSNGSEVYYIPVVGGFYRYEFDKIPSQLKEKAVSLIADWDGFEAEPTETTYTVTSDLLGNSEPATYAQIADMVKEWQYEGWDLETVEHTASDEVRVYATRDWDIDIDDNTPTRYDNWVVVTRDYCYLTVAVK